MHFIFILYCSHVLLHIRFFFIFYPNVVDFYSLREMFISAVFFMVEMTYKL